MYLLNATLLFVSLSPSQNVGLRDDGSQVMGAVHGTLRIYTYLSVPTTKYCSIPTATGLWIAYDYEYAVQFPCIDKSSVSVSLVCSMLTPRQKELLYAFCNRS